jgi:hypothetical protein
LIDPYLTDTCGYLGFHQSSYKEDSTACFSRSRCFGRYVPSVDTKRRVRCHHRLQRLRQDVVHRERSDTTRLDSFLRRQAGLEDCRIQKATDHREAVAQTTRLANQVVLDEYHLDKMLQDIRGRRQERNTFTLVLSRYHAVALATMITRPA